MVSSQVKPPDDAAEGGLHAGDFVSAYQVESLVGIGGMGWVYRARHALTAQRVALKILREDQLELDRSVDRMMREASILASVSHPGMPQFFECGVLRDGRPWIAMELIDGASLATRMQQGVMSADEVMDFLGPVAEVLASA